MASSSASERSEKYASEFPLPGGVEHYFETLVQMLRFIRDSNATQESLEGWIYATFPKASGSVAINGYLTSIGRTGLWQVQDGQIRLSPEGTAIVTQADSDPAEARRLVLTCKLRDIVGYDIVLRSLETGSRTLDEIHATLNGTLGVSWRSTNQPSFRVNWLRSLGYVEKDGNQYSLTPTGIAFCRTLPHDAERRGLSAPTISSKLAMPIESSPLQQKAAAIAESLQTLATSGGDGREFEQATESAFKFLGFDTQLISGAGNPDVLATASMGDRSYCILIDSKSRGSGVLRANDVNFPALEKQRQRAGADFIAIVAAGYSEASLEDFAIQHNVRLITTAELRELILAHSASTFPLDVLRKFFVGGGATDEDRLSDLLANGEGYAEAMQLARKVFSAVKDFQDKDGAIHVDSLYFILHCEHSLSALKTTADFLKSELVGALGETERGSLYTRVSPSALSMRLEQLTKVLDLNGER